MFKTSVATRVISFAVLITLLLASFPTAGAVAKENNEGMVTKWSQLVDSYNRQYITHNSAHHWVEKWMQDNRNASDSQKAEVLRHLTICNAALASATSVVMKHNGFDAKGNVVDKAAAQKSVKELAQSLQRHAGSIRNLDSHVNH